jgi:hypothetical protein
VHEFSPTSAHFWNSKFPRKENCLTSWGWPKFSISGHCKLYVKKKQRKRELFFRSRSSFLSFTLPDRHANAHSCENSRFAFASLLPRSYLSSSLHYVFHFQSLFPSWHFLTRMRMPICGKIFRFSLLPFSLDLTIPHLFMRFSHFQSLFLIWHFLTCMRMDILAKILCFSWLPLSLDPTFLHFFIMFSISNRYLRVGTF